MKELPILFSGKMVRAILEGRKTQTRRICKEYLQIYNSVSSHKESTEFDFHIRDGIGQIIKCPYGQPGDRIWVRETWNCWEMPIMKFPVHYKADNNPEHKDFYWRPSIHMPRWASRINLEIVYVRVERLNDISQEDCINEGIEKLSDKIYDKPHYQDYRNEDSCTMNPRKSFWTLWESINGKGSWEQNPWVWVIEFKCIEL